MRTKDFHFIKNRNPFSTGKFKEERLIAPDYMPASVKQGSSRPIIISSETSISSSSVASGTRFTVDLAIVNVPANTIIASVDWSIYIGSTADPAANLIPGGSSINHADWALFGPITTPLPLTGDGTHDAPHIYRSRTVISNNSGSTHTVTMIATWRLISNSGSALA